MFKRFLCWIFLLLLPLLIFSQENLSKTIRFYVNVYTWDANTNQFQFSHTYEELFGDLAPQVILKPINLSPAAQRIRLQLNFQSADGIIVPEEVIIENQILSDKENLIFTIGNPQAWFAKKEIQLSLFSHRPKLDSWLEIPINWSNAQGRQIPTDYNFTAKSPTTDLSTGYLEPGYAVQITAQDLKPLRRQFERLFSYGQFYYVEEASYYKVRIGTFGDRQTALNLLSAVKKINNGRYSDAFLINETNPLYLYSQKDDGGAALLDQAVKGVPRTPAADVPASYEASTQPFNPSLAFVSYEKPGVTIQLITKVQPPNLAPYRQLEDYAPLYVLREDRVYKLKMGPFKSKSEAEAVLPMVRAAGFSSAFVKE